MAKETMLFIITIQILLTYVSTTKFGFCYDYECPKFNVIHEASTYEVRCYKPSTWIERPSESTGDEGALSDWKSLFKDLYKYKSGFNEKHLKWNQRTTPIRMKFSSGVNLRKKAMQFYLPNDEHKGLVSTPLNQRVTVKISPKEECFYVLGFKSAGFRKTFKKTLLDHLEILKEAIFNDPFVKEGDRITTKLSANTPFYFNIYSPSKAMKAKKIKGDQYYEIMIDF